MLCMLFLYFFIPVLLDYKYPYEWVFMSLFVLPQPIWAAAMLSLVAHINKKVWWTVLVICALLFFTDLVCCFCQGTRFTSTIAIILLQTNIDETADFLSLGNVVWAFLWGLVLTLISVCGCYYFNRIWKRGTLLLRLEEWLGANIHRSGILMLAVAALSVLSFMITLHVEREYLSNYWQRQINIRYACTPLSIYVCMSDVLFETSQIDLDTLSQSIEDVSVSSVRPDSLNIVLVIGESHTKHHSDLYGYFFAD